MAPDHRFEPRLPESESGVLPLHQSGKEPSPNRSPAERVRFGKGRRRLRIWSFRGSYTNRGSKMEQASSDVVIPAGFEPSITALKGRRPNQLVEGTTPARSFGLVFVYAEIWITPHP